MVIRSRHTPLPAEIETHRYRNQSETDCETHRYWNQCSIAITYLKAMPAPTQVVCRLPAFRCYQKLLPVCAGNFQLCPGDILRCGEATIASRKPSEALQSMRSEIQILKSADVEQADKEGLLIFFRLWLLIYWMLVLGSTLPSGITISTQPVPCKITQSRLHNITRCSSMSTFWGANCTQDCNPISFLILSPFQYGGHA